MLFPTMVFAVFFLVVYLGHRGLMRHPLAWKVFLLLSSYVFYGYWDARFVGLIVASSLFNHWCARAIDGSSGRRRRRTWMILSVVFNLGTLAFFKYYGFFAVSVYAVFAQIGLSPPPIPLLNIILPVGISFFTFQAMSYVIDIYRGKTRPAASLLDFAVYLSFFPQLVAGPIVRASVFLPQLERPDPDASVESGRAATLIFMGLFKKTVIAHYLAAEIVDPVFAHPAAYGAIDNLLAVYGYAVQIYCDFSAYSDIAIGIALLLGFRFPINFDAPYCASSIRDFWGRWHISLSTWLRDYLYIPLGGSRVASPRLCFNLMITFLLGGLWHGAAWTFVVWGALHGVYIVLARLVGDYLETHRKPGRRDGGLVRGWVKCVWVFHLVCLSWIFFRAETFADAWTMIRQLGEWRTAPNMLNAAVILLLPLGLLTQVFDGDRLVKLWNRVSGWHPLLQGAAAALLMTLWLALAPRGVAPFIYFQF